MRAAKVQASLRIRAVSPEPSLLAHTNSESRGTFRQKARSLAPLNGWACAVEICHDRMLEDTNSLDGAQLDLVYARNFTDSLVIIVSKTKTSVRRLFNLHEPRHEKTNKKTVRPAKTQISLGGSVFAVRLLCS